MPSDDPEWLKKARAEGRILSERPHTVDMPEPTSNTPDSNHTASKSKQNKSIALVAAAFDKPAKWTIPLYVVAGDNARGNKVRVGRAGHERRVVAKHLAAHLLYLVPFAWQAAKGSPVRVIMTRLGRLMDTDGLTASCKYVRDTIALFLGVDDGPRGPVEWVYQQLESAEFGVVVEMAVIA